MVQGTDEGRRRNWEVDIMWIAELVLRQLVKSIKSAPGGTPVISQKAKMSSGPLPQPTQPFAQPYSTYPPAYSQYSTQSFPPVNYASQPQSAVYPAFQLPYGKKDPTSWIDDLSPQELSGVNPEIASRAMHRFISLELKHEGFNAAEPAALGRLEDEVVHCGLLVLSRRLSILTSLDARLVIQDLHRKIHDYANLANRTAPLVSDMYDISQECELDTQSLRLTSELSKLRRRGTLD